MWPVRRVHGWRREPDAMSEVQCLKVRIRSGMTDRVLRFLEEARPLEILVHLVRDDEA